MQKHVNTISFQTVVTGLLALGLIVVSTFQIQGTIERQQETQAYVDYATLQRAEVFRLTELARRLTEDRKERDPETIILQIEVGIANFDDRQVALREGDPAADIVPIQNEFTLDILDNLDGAWSRHKLLLLEFIANPEQTDILDQLSNRASDVFLQADRLAESANADLVSAQDQAQNTFLVLGTLAIVTIGFVGFLFYRIIRDLRRVQAAAVEFSETRYTARAPEKSFAELANVGSVLNQMADAVMRREKDLTNLNQTLETRVKERTAELQKSEEQLRKRSETLAFEVEVRKRAEEVALQASAMKSAFLANVSHELRTPLNSIIGYVDLLLLGMDGELTDSQKEKLSRASGSSRRLAGLINDIMDLSRIEAGRLEFVDEPFSPREVLENLHKQMEHLAVEKKLTFQLHHDNQLPEKIVGDRRRIAQILVNILSNAFKSTEQGSVTISTKTKNYTWELRVEDTGIGIPVHVRQTIFEPFRQAEEGSTRRFGGTGLGLSISRDIVLAMGGKIRVDSTVGKGSTFTVSLPLKIPDNQQEEATSATAGEEGQGV